MEEVTEEGRCSLIILIPQEIYICVYFWFHIALGLLIIR
jgi:hypothetical protein